MKALKHLFVLAALAVPFAAAHAGVEVSFVKPDHFVDANPRGFNGDKERAAVLAKLRQHLERQGERYLKPSQTLTIEVLDLDLAGRVDWWRPQIYDVRIMRDIDAPTMKVRYTLSENGAILASGEERIADLGYLMRINVHGSTDSLRYEKIMLNDWFRRRFAKLGVPS